MITAPRDQLSQMYPGHSLEIEDYKQKYIVEFELVFNIHLLQASYYTQASQVLSDLTNKLGWKKGDLSDEDCQQQLQQKLAEIKSLSIVEDR